MDCLSCQSRDPGRGGGLRRIPALEIAKLQEQLAIRNKALFGPMSERRHRSEYGQGEGVGVDESAECRRGHGPQSQHWLRVVETPHELEGADKVCPSCGGQLG